MAKYNREDVGIGAEDNPDAEVELDLTAEDELEDDLDFTADEHLFYGDDPEELLDDEADDGEELVWDADELSKPVAATPGCAVSFFVDNKRHHAICLAVIGDEVLLEHKDATRCFLFIGKITEIVPRIRRGVVSATITVGALKRCRYRTVPKKWLQEMIKAGLSWKGVEGPGKVAPAPGELLRGQMELF
ncbi:RNA polymerase I-specific transcription initiation factor RRN3 family protein [Geomonas anaerohicana]|uniref:RNA polymerase I-specific transcription initiation factor RRN3 family protein n=1 Tax=Geomonas anaerohicana TaxID=2798583 RepID=UPI001F34E928|nr:RNA polymerase I-specific transcription initiation factor RRN3 family protein [Geomonas anaerohicana]